MFLVVGQNTDRYISYLVTAYILIAVGHLSCVEGGAFVSCWIMVDATIISHFIVINWQTSNLLINLSPP